MVALPSLTAVTTPFATVATPSSLLVQVTVLSVAVSGVTVAVILAVPPGSRFSADGLRVTPVTGITLALASL